MVQTVIISFIFLMALFIVQNLKNSYSISRVMRMRHFWAQNGPFAPIFFWKIISIILIYLLAPFIVENIKKILLADPELWGCAIFGRKMAHLSWTIFLVQTIIITFIYLLALFTVKNFKKFFQKIQSYEDAPFWGPKWFICPKQFFFLENY